MQYLRSTLLIGVILFIFVNFTSCDEKKSSKDKHLNKHTSDKEHETLKKPVKDKTEKSEDKHLDKHTSEHETSKKPIKDEEKGADKHLDKHTSEHEASKKPIKDEKKSEDKHLGKHTSEHETSKKPIKDEEKGADKHLDKHTSEHEASKKPIKDEKKSKDKHLDKHTSEHETTKKPIKDEEKNEDKHLKKHASEQETSKKLIEDEEKSEEKHASDKEHETSKKPVKDKKKGEGKHLKKHASEHETSKKPIKDEKKDEDKHLDKHTSEHETSKKPIKDEKKSDDKHLNKHASDKEHETSKKPVKDKKKGEDKHLNKHTSDKENEASKKPVKDKDKEKGEDKHLDKHTSKHEEASKKPIKDEKKGKDKHLNKHTSDHETTKKPIKDEEKSEDKHLKKHASEHETSKKLIKDEKKSEAKPLIKYVSQHETSKKKKKMYLKNHIKAKSLEKNAVIKHEIVSKKEIKNSKKALEVEVTIKKGKTGKKSPTPDLFSHSFEDGESGSGEGESGSGEDIKCNKPIDLVVALDSSESIREANWTKLIRFTKDLMKSLDPSLTRIAIIRYNAKAEVPVPLGFFQSFEAFSTTLDGVFYEPGGTRTDVALSQALAVFASGGQRRASKILLVVTDNPTNDIRISKDNLVLGRELVEKPSENLKSYEVITFGVGVKYGLTEEERGDLNQELTMITQDEEGDKRIVEVENFEELLTSANEVAGKICLVNGGWSSWTPWSQCTASCGGGTKVRLRRCDNPKPSNNGTNCTELGGSSVETRTCNIYPCSDGIEVTSMSQRPLQNPSRPLAQSILFSKDCSNGFDFVYVDSNQMSASSVYSKNTGDQTIMKFHAPGNGILYNVMNAGAWCAEHSESVSNCQDQYIQTDLKVPVRIAKIGTQGEASLFGSNWVTFYKFNYSVDGRTWKQYKTILTGNMDRDTVKENLISPPVIARYVRFNPVHWNVRGGNRVHDICLRVGVFTCTEVKNIKHVHKKVKRALIRPRKYRLPY